MFLFRILLSTLLGLLLASDIGLALGHGHGHSSRYDILRGTRGESACTLKDDIDWTCTRSSTRRDFLLSPRNDDTSLVPSECTCNAIFFNIWSACYYSTGNNTLPIFTQWTQNCTTNSINMDSSTQFSKVQGNLGIDVPSWAKMGIPENSTFDIQRAVTIANSGRWTTLQKMLPMMSSLSTLVISGIILTIYQRYYQRKLSRGSSSSNPTNRIEWPKGLKSLHLHTSHKVTTTIDKDESWEIDGPVGNQPSFVNITPSFNDAIHGHPATSSFDEEEEEEDIEMAADVHHDEKSKTVSSSNSTTEKTTMGIRKPMRSRLPWKRRPPYIRLVPATPRFRVDDVKSIFTCSGEAVGRSEINHEDVLPPEVEETRSLITASESAERDSQEVILISKGDRSFTLESRSENTVSVNSHIKIISPSVSSTSPHSVMYPVSATKPKLHIPIPPPPPSHAAPAPPVMPQSLRPTGDHSNNRKQSIACFQSQFLTPIKEASSPSRSSLSSNNTTTLRRSLAIRRCSNPDSVSSSSQHISPAAADSSSTTVLSPSSSSYSNNLQSHRTASPSPSYSNTLGLGGGGSEDDFYMESTNGQYHEPSDTSIAASFYYNNNNHSPVQTPHAIVPQKRQLRSAGPAAFYAGPVRGAGYYSIRTDSNQ